MPVLTEMPCIHETCAAEGVGVYRYIYVCIYTYCSKANYEIWCDDTTQAPTPGSSGVSAKPPSAPGEPRAHPRVLPDRPRDGRAGPGLHLSCSTPAAHPSLTDSPLLCGLAPYGVTAGTPKIPFCYPGCRQTASLTAPGFQQVQEYLTRVIQKKTSGAGQPSGTDVSHESRRGSVGASTARLQPGPCFPPVVGTSPVTPRCPHAGHPCPWAGKHASFQPTARSGVMLLGHVMCLRLPRCSSLLSGGKCNK